MSDDVFEEAALLPAAAQAATAKPNNRLSAAVRVIFVIILLSRHRA